MVRAFTADSAIEGERYVALLRQHGIEAVLRPAPAGSGSPNSADIWISSPSNLHRALAHITACRLGPWMDSVSLNFDQTSVWAFSAKDRQEAEHYLRLLADRQIHAVVAEELGKDGEPVPVACPAIWVPKNELAAAEKAHAEYEAWKRDSPDNPERTWRVSRALQWAGFLMLMGACVLLRVSFSGIAGVPWVCIALFLFGICLTGLHSGLTLFRQFVWVDLLLLTSYLPAVVGLTLRSYEPATPPTIVVALGLFVVLTLVVWAGVVGLMNRSSVKSTEERACSILAAFLGLALVWLVALWFLAA